MSEMASAHPPRHRMFFAIWPDADAREGLESLAQRVAVDAKGRATAAERLHLTVAFIGESTVEEIARLGEIGKRIAAGSAPFGITLDKVGMFRDSGIAWIGPREPPAPLHELASRLRAELANAGFAIERRGFRAHLTLARRCERRPRMANAPSVAWKIDALTLMASELSPQGPRYAVVAQWPLGGAR